MLLVFTTFSGEDEAARVIRTLVEEKLIACGTVSAPATSIYRWKDQITSEKEWVAALKTTEECFEPLSLRLRELHSYEVPEIVAIPVTAASSEYSAWVSESCRKS